MSETSYTCTGCIPIDKSIVDTYVALLNTEASVKNAEDGRQEAEGQGDYSDATQYPNTRRAKEAARQTAEANRVKNEGSDGPDSEGYSTSRIKMEIDRQSAETQRQTNEGIGATDAECAAGSRRKNESIRQANEEVREANEETRQAQEGTPSDEASASGSRWARYKYAENSRESSYEEAEGESTDEASATGSRWARYNKAEADREDAYDTAEAARDAAMAPLAGYYACSTAASTAAKEVAATNYVLTNGGSIKVKFTYANSASSPTLNINSTGAKAIVYNGAAASAANTWAAGDVVEFYYDPTYNSNAGAFVGIPTVVSVSQNSQTGHTDITIGDTTTPVASVEDVNQLGQYTDSPEFIRVITDGEDKILEGITEEGRKIINIPIGTPAIDVNHSKSKEYVSVVLDKDGRVVSGRDTNGRLIEYVGVTTPVTETDALKVNYEVILSEKAADSLRASIDNQISTDRKKQEYSALFKDAGNSVESFLFYTDPHYFESNGSCELSGESKEYIKRMKNYFENTPTDFVINGGDWLNTHQKVIGIEDLGWVDGMMRGLFGNNYYPVFGNHESNPYSGGNNIPIEVVKNLWFRKWGKMYYSFLANNSRFYVLDSGSDGTVEMDSYRWEEVDWFANELLNGDDANIVMVIHIGDLNYTNPSLFGQNTPPITDNLTKIAEAYNSRNEITLNGVTYNFTTASGTIHCLLCGHSHYDANAVINSIPAICFDDAMTGNFTLVLLDFDNRKLKSIRVGTGDNREITIL